MVTKEGVSVDPTKVEAILNWAKLTYVTEAGSFLSVAGYHKRFVLRFSKLDVPIIRLLPKSNKFERLDECEVSF